MLTFEPMEMLQFIQEKPMYHLKPEQELAGQLAGQKSFQT